MPKLIKSFKKQFSMPKGYLGKIAGNIMALENKRLNNWTLSLLSINNNDYVLEVGYGPGVCMKKILQDYSQVTIHGIDVSETMKKQAENRLKEFIEDERAKVFVGDIEIAELPNDRYNKVLSVNNYTIWKHPKKGLERLYKSMKENGQIAITMQPREENASTIKTRMFANRIYQDLCDCGFKDVNISYKRLYPILAVCVTATKA
ncbi:class I SAM-dependent methyltransferase [Metabacillus halosaccharovorans]|uniref:class I SAM-dependent methyltransferase n=1 Tax=Metabacillus halosaccharovorans TaxID=930124 RepID=UPI00203D5C0A|nr:class I SAM-dependent methyltransferase [Metabacillus halosaccharovorans]MCM3444692.1 class I SAM-dependent methyltransferase [Metabacillus halosaccharovorans]